MSLVGAVGYSSELDGRTAAQQAAQAALKGLRAASPRAALVFFSERYDSSEVMQGLLSVLGEIPLWGAATLEGYAGHQSRRVVVGLLGGALTIDSAWIGHFAQDSIGAALDLKTRLERMPASVWQAVLLALDGVNGDVAPVLAAFEGCPLPVAGFLAGGNYAHSLPSVVGDTTCAGGGLSALWLGGALRLGAGTAHGWKDSGVHLRITRSRDFRVYELDDMPAAQRLAQVFGCSAQDWMKPPLAELLRLYPLGVRDTPSGEYSLAAPLAVERDGALRLNLRLAEGELAHLMTADPDACLQAARRAARTARAAAGKGKAALALVLVDQGWQVLFETRPAAVYQAVDAELKGVPLLGAATLGQIHCPESSATPLATNLAIQVVLFCYLE